LGNRPSFSILLTAGDIAGNNDVVTEAIDTFIREGKVPSVKLTLNKWPYRILDLFLLRNLFGRMDESTRAGFAAQSAMYGKCGK
jgi:hypothetical protein